MGKVHQMHMHEVAQVDYHLIDALQRSVGEFRYQEIAEDVVYTLSRKITELSQSARDCDYAAVGKLAAKVAKIAAQIGLCGVTQTAKDAAICAGRSDSTGLAAQVARLVRLAESSIISVVEFGEQAP